MCGTNDEHGFGIGIDFADRIYITGYTQSATDYPLPASNPAGTYDITSITGTVDVVLSSFSPSYEYVWGTYFGGGYSEKGYGVCPTPFSKLHLVGWTLSEGPLTGVVDPFPVVEEVPYYYQQWINGSNLGGDFGKLDGFLARFDIDPVFTSTEEQIQQNGISAYPNPSLGEYTVTIDNIDNEDINLYIYNYLGQEVKFESYKSPGHNFRTVIDLSNMSNGIYVMNVLIGKEIKTIKLVKN